MSKRPEGTPQEEIEAWARRMVDEVEDFEYIETAADWRAYCDDRLPGTSNLQFRDNQLAALERGRGALVEFYTELGIGIKPVHFTKGPLAGRTIDYYVDTTGRFGKRGTYISRGTIAARIDYLRAELDPEKNKRRTE